MDIGSELRTARMARVLSLDDISRDTKISPSVLRAIESNAFDKVPRGLFARGYLRAYARVVGLDSEAVVQHYRNEFEAAEPPVNGHEPTASAGREVAIDVGDGTGSGRGQILGLVVILAVALVYLVPWRDAKPAAGADLQATEAAAAVLPAAVPAAAVPVGTSGSSVAAKAQLAIEIHPQGPCWVDVTADGEHRVARLMNAGDRETVTAGEDLTLRVGDPGAFAFSINGVAGRSLGPEGHPVTVRINRSNYQTFLGEHQGAF
jgi:cytoskeleton protein RodZ